MILKTREPDRVFAVSVLIIDDESGCRTANRIAVEAVFKEIDKSKINICLAESIDDALAELAREQFHVILLDRDLGKDSKGELIDGIKYIPSILSLQPNAEVFMVTGHEDTRLVVEALKLGASGYLLKRADEEYAGYWEQQIGQALMRSKAKIDSVRNSLVNGSGFSDYVCISPAMRMLDIRLENLAEVSTSVLFLGPSGLGKTAGAKRLSDLRRAFLGQENRIFLNVNISSIGRELADSILFGHEKGAFTGADRRKQGFFELANGGDLFLDEIGDASLDLQQKLLKVVEEREFQRVGGDSSLHTSARLIFATNRDLEAMVRAGTFRADLYARISTISLQMPSLEERKEDIKDICKAILRRISKEHPNRVFSYETFPDDLKEYLHRDNIPHNIRGIQNDLERLIVMSPRDKSGQPNLAAWKSTLGLSRRSVFHTARPSESIQLSHLMELPTDLIQDGFPGLKEAKRIFERKLVEEATRKFKTNSEIARALKLAPSNVLGKISRYAGTSGE